MTINVSQSHGSSPTVISRRAAWAKNSAISYLMQQAVENRGVISLAAGLVDETSLPTEECLRASSELFSNGPRAREALQYGTTAGADVMRNELLQHLARLEGTSVSDLGIEANRIVLTTGSQQLLALVADALFDPGDICLIAAPTYFVFLGVLDGVGAEVIPVTTDEHGMVPAALEESLMRIKAEGKLNKVKLIYLVSDFENPSGVSLSTNRRREMVEIAHKWSHNHKIFVLEDAAYRELRYDGTPLPSIWSFDKDRDTVILAQTFSKSFSPGVRVGFGVLPASLIQSVSDLKGNTDFGSPNLNQHLMATVFAGGHYTKHVESVRNAYRLKRDAMLAALDRELGGQPGVHWLRPEGGLYVWLSLPSHIETGFQSPLFQSAAKQHHMMYVPGELCYPGKMAMLPRHQMRLSFGVQDVSGIDAGINRLAAAIRSFLK